LLATKTDTSSCILGDCVHIHITDALLEQAGKLATVLVNLQEFFSHLKTGKPSGSVLYIVVVPGIELLDSSPWSWRDLQLVTQSIEVCLTLNWTWLGSTPCREYFLCSDFDAVWVSLTADQLSSKHPEETP
jgi:hypothetical protein